MQGWMLNLSQNDLISLANRNHNTLALSSIYKYANHNFMVKALKSDSNLVEKHIFFVQC